MMEAWLIVEVFRGRHLGNGYHRLWEMIVGRGKGCGRRPLHLLSFSSSLSSLLFLHSVPLLIQQAACAEFFNWEVIWQTARAWLHSIFTQILLLFLVFSPNLCDGSVCYYYLDIIPEKEYSINLQMYGFLDFIYYYRTLHEDITNSS